MSLIPRNSPCDFDALVEKMRAIIEGTVALLLGTALLYCAAVLLWPFNIFETSLDQISAILLLRIVVAIVLMVIGFLCVALSFVFYLLAFGISSSSHSSQRSGVPLSSSV